VEVLFEVTGYGEEIPLEQVWESIEAIVSRPELRQAVRMVTEMVPPPDADPDGEMRARLAERIGMVSGFLKLLTEVIAFESNTEAAPVLEAMRACRACLMAVNARSPRRTSTRHW
jgi:hypothetical protein